MAQARPDPPQPGVAVVYHAREHGLTRRPGFVLVQGRASFPSRPDRAWLESITPQWERFLGPRATGLAGRMLDVYYWQRVPITVQVERIVAYTDDAAAGEPEVLGRRAGLTSHEFQARMIGQEQRLHTGWLESDGSDRVDYAPHTNAGYRLPRSKLIFVLGSASIALRMRKARGVGVAAAGGR